MKKLIKALLNESLKLKSWEEYTKLVCDAYLKAQDFDASAVGHWHTLNESNYTLFTRLLSKVNIIFTTIAEPTHESIVINGRTYKIIKEQGEPYSTQSEMKNDVAKNNTIKISIDHSTHPVFSVVDNIVFRTVHDYIVHVLGGKQFGAKGEIASYNLHAKLVPKNAIPAIFTEVVGQASVAVVTGSFPTKQKIVLLKGFDYMNVGEVDDYNIQNKELVKNK